MEQSTKLFLTLGFFFLLFTTLNGHLEKYLRVLFGGKAAGDNGGGSVGQVIKSVAGGGASDALKQAQDKASNFSVDFAGGWPITFGSQ